MYVWTEKNTGFGTNLILYCLSVAQCKPVVSVQHLPDQSPSSPNLIVKEYILKKQLSLTLSRMPIHSFLHYLMLCYVMLSSSLFVIHNQARFWQFLITPFLKDICCLLLSELNPFFTSQSVRNKQYSINLNLF